MHSAKKKTVSLVCDLVFRSKYYKFYNHPLKILMYHRFMDDEDKGYVLKKRVFENQLRFLKKHFSIYGLEAFLRLTTSEKRRVKNPMIITVDDGYLNFYKHAFPILRNLSIPATVFVPFNFVESGDWMWQDKNIYILRNAKFDSYNFKWRSDTIKIVRKPFPQLIKSLWRIYNKCLPLSLEEKHDFSNELAYQLGVCIPPKPVPEFAPLTWEQIREMEKAKIAIGSHTMNHLILTELSEKESLYEIGESKKLLELRLGHQVRTFCYPNGNHNQKIIEQVKACGYQCAVTTLRGNNRKLSEFFRLKRIGPSDESMNLFLKSIYL